MAIRVPRMPKIRQKPSTALVVREDKQISRLAAVSRFLKNSSLARSYTVRIGGPLVSHGIPAAAVAFGLYASPEIIQSVKDHATTLKHRAESPHYDLIGDQLRQSGAEASFYRLPASSQQTMAAMFDKYDGDRDRIAALGAITIASERKGVDPKPLIVKAYMESSLRPGAGAKTSSARGLVQYTEQTWFEDFRDQAADFSPRLEKLANQIKRKPGENTLYVDNPAVAKQIQNMRISNPAMSATFAAEKMVTDYPSLKVASIEYANLGNNDDFTINQIGDGLNALQMEAQFDNYFCWLIGDTGCARHEAALASDMSDKTSRFRAVNKDSFDLPANEATVYDNKGGHKERVYSDAQINANKSIFYDGQGDIRSIAQVQAEVEDRIKGWNDVVNGAQVAYAEVQQDYKTTQLTDAQPASVTVEPAGMTISTQSRPEPETAIKVSKRPQARPWDDNNAPNAEKAETIAERTQSVVRPKARPPGLAEEFKSKRAIQKAIMLAQGDIKPPSGPKR